MSPVLLDTSVFQHVPFTTGKILGWRFLCFSWEEDRSDRSSWDVVSFAAAATAFAVFVPLSLLVCDCWCYLLLLFASVLLFLIAFDGTTDAAGDDSDSNVDLCQYIAVMVLVASSYNYSYYLIEFDLCRGIRWHLKSYSAYWLIVSSNLTNWIKFKTENKTTKHLCIINNWSHRGITDLK